MSAFGQRVRALREAKAAQDPEFGLRRVAQRVGISPTFLSRIETGKGDALPSEENIVKLAHELGEDPDRLLALAGKVRSELLDLIIEQPEAFAKVIEALGGKPTETFDRVAQEVRDGDW